LRLFFIVRARQSGEDCYPSRIGDTLLSLFTPARRRKMSRWGFKALLSAAALIQACGAAGQPQPALDVTGKWAGNSNTSCGVLLSDKGRCGAINEIAFTLFQDGSDLTGVYGCSTGTVICRNLNENGKVSAGTINGSLVRIRVAMADGSSCMFNGHFQSESAMGGFSCYQGGGLVEQGGWRVKRMF
jgi:hypothetical protein